MLRCPDRRCRYIVDRVDLEHGSTIALTCRLKSCRAHWWATRFRAGSVRDQLLADYEDADFVDSLMRLYDLPAWLEEPAYWQVILSGAQLYAFNKDAAAGRLARSANLLRGLFRALPRAAL